MAITGLGLLVSLKLPTCSKARLGSGKNEISGGQCQQNSILCLQGLSGPSNPKGQHNSLVSD